MDAETIQNQLEALLSGETDPVANLANAAALLWERLPDINWVGFYLLKGGELVLGPFQGRPACTRIAPARGVCGACVTQNRAVRVEDVRAFPGHIACDARSKAELVLPLRGADGRPFGVLDIDSETVGRFTAEDEREMERAAAVVAAMLGKAKEA